MQRRNNQCIGKPLITDVSLIQYFYQRVTREGGLYETLDISYSDTVA